MHTDIYLNSPLLPEIHTIMSSVNSSRLIIEIQTNKSLLKCKLRAIMYDFFHK